MNTFRAACCLYRRSLCKNLLIIRGLAVATNTESIPLVVRPEEVKRLLDENGSIRLLEIGVQEDDFNVNHIPGAQFYGRKRPECEYKSTVVKGNLPRRSDFETYCRNLGISNNTHVIAYERHDKGIFNGPRLWWTFRVFGHNRVSIMGGGIAKWVANGYPVTDLVEPVPKGDFVAKFRPELIKTFVDVERNLMDGRCQLIDARGASRFDGNEPEPTEELESGHIPGAINFPYADLLDDDTKTMKAPEELRKVFKEKGIDLQKPIISMCGQGVTACIASLAAHLCNVEDVPVYDGSWMDWYLYKNPHVVAELPKE